MARIPINEKYDLRNAIFWASFAIEDGQQEKHCPTVTLYSNEEEEFFVVEKSPNVTPTMTELIEDPGKWLGEQVERIKAYLPG